MRGRMRGRMRRRMRGRMRGRLSRLASRRLAALLECDIEAGGIRLRRSLPIPRHPIPRHLNGDPAEAQPPEPPSPHAPRSLHPRPRTQIPSQRASQRRGVERLARPTERVRPRGVRQTCQAEPGAPGGALAVPRRARPPLGRTCKVRLRPRSPVFRGAHGRLAPPTGRARPSGACPTCRAEAGAPGGALAVPRLLYPAHFLSAEPHSARLHSHRFSSLLFSFRRAKFRAIDNTKDKYSRRNFPIIYSRSPATG